MAEARAVKLEELVPKALLVLEANLSDEDSRVRQRAAEHVLDRSWGKPVQSVEQKPETVEDKLRKLRPDQLAKVERLLRLVTDEDADGSPDASH